MEWRTPGEDVERPLGIWSRAALEESLEQEARADTQLRRSLGAIAGQAKAKKRGTYRPPPRGEFPCPECGKVLVTAAARGSHREGKHGVPGVGSLHVA